MIRDALTGSFEIPVYFDYPATFIWALSGALLAARLRLDPTGVAIIALVTAAGGGLLRDGLFLQAGPPALLRDPVYIILIGIAAVIVITAGTAVLRIPHFDEIVALFDLFGLGAYAIVGLDLSLSLGLSMLAAIFVGTVNAVGGGVLRDIVLRRTPQLLEPGAPITIVGDHGLRRVRRHDAPHHAARGAGWSDGHFARLGHPHGGAAPRSPDGADTGFLGPPTTNESVSVGAGRGRPRPPRRGNACPVKGICTTSRRAVRTSGRSTWITSFACCHLLHAAGAADRRLDPQTSPTASSRRKRANICVIAALPRHSAAGASAFSSACCCSVVRFVLSTVPPNLAISGNTRS